MSTVIVYTDAAKNSVTRVVSAYGRQKKFDNRGYRIGVVCDQKSARYINSKATDSFSAETYALLKGLEFALECRPDATEVVIRSDCQQAGQETRHTQANQYLRAMRSIAHERGVVVRHEFVPGSENPADRVSRTEDDPATTAPDPAPSPAQPQAAGIAIPLDAITDDEMDAHDEIANSERSANGRKKHYIRLRERVAARLGIASSDCQPPGLGHVIRQAAVRRRTGGHSRLSGGHHDD